MNLEQSFEVAAPVQRVWNALIDVEQVAPCLPGAAVSGRNEDGSFNGTFTVKIGPTSASYAGKLLMEQVDEGAHTATMQANGTDKRGQGSAKAKIVSTVSPAGEGRARVDVSTDYHITGRLARFGRGGMIEDISERLLREFAERLRGMLEGSGAASGGVGEAAKTDSQDPGARPGGNSGVPSTSAEAAAPGAGAGPPTEVGVGSASDTDVGSASDTGVGSASDTGVGSASDTGVGSASDTGVGSASDTDVGSASDTDVGSASDTDVGSASDTDVGSASESGAGRPSDVDAGSGELPAEAISSTRVIPQPTPSEPVGGLSLIASVMWQRFRRNPIPAAFIAGLLMALAVLGRKRSD
jgi:uncharacterized protein